MSDQGPETSAGAITGSQTRKGQYQKKKRGFENAKNFLLFASPDSEKDEIENLPGEELLARQKELAKHIQLDMKDGRPSIFTFDIDKFAKPRLTRDSGRSYKGETINLTPDLATTERYHTLRHGLNYGYRKNDQGGRKLVLAARFTPYSAMSPEEIETIRHLSRHFHRQGELCYENNLNAAHKEAGRPGKMFAEGYCVGFDDDSDARHYKASFRKVQSKFNGDPKVYAEHIIDSVEVNGKNPEFRDHT